MISNENMTSFLNVVGHDNSKKLLSAAYKNQKIAHGYLFIGVEKLGKFLLAKEFVKKISCQKGDFGDACGICDKCKAIDNEADPDVLFVNSSKNRILDKNGNESKTIPVEQIRNLQHHLSLFPYNSKYKIAIVDEAHKLSEQAINAFLKTLEEPRGSSVIILVADESKFLLKTLISRMQVIRFWPLKNEVIENFLIGRNATVENAKIISSISSGRPGFAIDFLKNRNKVDEYFKNEEIFWIFFRMQLSEKITFLENLAKNEENIREVLQFWVLCLRKKFLSGYLSQSIKKCDDQSKNEIKKMIDFVNSLIVILNLINNSNINKRLALEVLALEI